MATDDKNVKEKLARLEVYVAKLKQTLSAGLFPKKHDINPENHKTWLNHEINRTTKTIEALRMK